MTLSNGLFFIIIFLIAIPPLQGALFDLNNDSESLTSSEMKQSSATDSLSRLSRFLSEKSLPLPLPANYTCDKYPKVCRLKGSAGRNCCQKKCVNVKTDRLNCGSCRYKCRYNESCCKGKCKNTYSDKKNCGGCHIRCNNKDLCNYGMCNYA